MYQVLLGPDTDDVQFSKPCEAVRALGGTIEDSEWIVGGSREITVYKIALPSGSLEAVMETYVGLALRGNEGPVSVLANEVLPNSSV